MTNHKHQILTAPDKGISSAQSVLSLLFRTLLFHRAVGTSKWDRLVENYLDDPRTGVYNNPGKRSTERGNLNRTLLADTMTWRTFHDKGLRLLNPTLTRITVENVYADGERGVATVEVTPQANLSREELEKIYEQDEVELLGTDERPGRLKLAVQRAGTVAGLTHPQIEQMTQLLAESNLFRRNGKGVMREREGGDD
jgi:hypothetical protein